MGSVSLLLRLHRHDHKTLNKLPKCIVVVLVATDGMVSDYDYRPLKTDYRFPQETNPDIGGEEKDLMAGSGGEIIERGCCREY